MRKFCFLCLYLLLIILVSCTNTVSDISDDENLPQMETGIKENEDIATEKEKVVVSGIATEDFLLPFEDFSWEMTETPEFVMLHFTSAVVLSKDNPYDISSVRGIFEENNISIHYIIDRDGKVFCWMPETRAAWHAGKGAFGGVDKYNNSMNKYSIGIEILAIGSKSDMTQYLTGEEYDSLDKELIGFTEEQYESLDVLIRDICQRNDIPFDKNHIIGHDMYNPLKSDPGELFRWERLFNNQ